MDDFVISNLHESRNEWCARLVSILTPLVQEGIKSIFNEAWKMCLDNDEVSKYLMTFQNLLSRIPKWNSVIIEEERNRIIEKSGCNYLEDLITCVHIIQLKVLTCIRVGNKQKKIDISTPKLDHFIHKVYVNVARKVYTNVFLFEKNISPLLVQKNNRELELIIQECIMTTIRESIPTEAIIRAYMDESVEQEEEVIIEEVPPENSEETKEEVEKEQKPEEKVEIKPNEEENIPSVVPAISNIDNELVKTRLTFDDYDKVLDLDSGSVNQIMAPKDIDTLEQISTSRALQRKLDEEEEEDESDKIKIHTDSIDLGELDIMDFGGDSKEDNIKLDVEELF
jgi:Family of unknown function (DUF5764)